MTEQQTPIGRIFSIEEFSTYDGPGIRMTVFLKGCPLRCTWCHNPEGQRREQELVRSPNGCRACGACTRKGEELTGTPALVPESVGVCPLRLIRLSGEDLTPEELVRKIERNLPVLNMSGGGVTFSGGEPLLYHAFVGACCDLLAGKTSRALQTCGYAPSEVFRALLPRLDYVLYDLKHLDDAVHRRFTGVSNAQILENYRILVESGVPFTTRIPLIPTVNDTPENLEATAALLASYGVRRVELLPYNRMAGGKYKMLGRTYSPGFDGSIRPEPRTEIWERYGVEVTIL